MLEQDLHCIHGSWYLTGSMILRHFHQIVKFCAGGDKFCLVLAVGYQDCERSSRFICPTRSAGKDTGRATGLVPQQRDG